MEQALWAKAREWEEAWVEELGIVKVQVLEGIAYVLLAGKRLPIRRGRLVLQ